MLLSSSALIGMLDVLEASQRGPARDVRVSGLACCLLACRTEARCAAKLRHAIHFLIVPDIYCATRSRRMSPAAYSPTNAQQEEPQSDKQMRSGCLHRTAGDHAPYKVVQIR